MQTWERITSLEGLGEIPFVKISGCQLLSLGGLGEMNKTIILPSECILLLKSVPLLDNYTVKRLPKDLVMLRNNEVL
jgi:hypothetical protein